MKPKVSVIMPTYNTDKNHLYNAINSILNQSFKDFELIIVDDGSADDISFILNKYKDERIILKKNTTNLGIAEALNEGVKISRGAYIARMDSDDIAFKHRLKYQLYVLEKKKVSVVGSAITNIGGKFRINIFPRKSDEIKINLLFSCPLVHPTIMINKSTITDGSYKYSSQYSCEDYHLWSEMSKNDNISFYNIQVPLLKYRRHSGQMTQTNKSKIYHSSKKIRKELLEFYGVYLSEKEENIFNDFSNGTLQSTKDNIIVLDTIFSAIISNLIINFNIKISVIRKVLLTKILKEYFRNILFFRGGGQIIFQLKTANRLMNKSSKIYKIYTSEWN